jgi:uncharacterized protein YjgD (DUF1641 family)
MARPIPFDAPTRDAKVELLHRLERAPADHAAALLDAYELLETLHDRQILDTLRGLIGSGPQVLEIGVEAALKPESIHAIRNMLVVFNMLGSIDPSTMKKFTQPIPQALQVVSLQERPPSLWTLLKTSMFDRDFRRGLGAMIAMLRSIGLGLADRGKPDAAHGKQPGAGAAI